MTLIPFKKYKEIVGKLAILCVDMVAQNSRGEYLLIKRSNEPKKGRWWVIGGRVFKGEKLHEAVVRKMKEETGLVCKDIRPIGYFELVDGVHPFDEPVTYHAVSVVFAVTFNEAQTVKLDKQSAGYKFSKQLPKDFKIMSFKKEQTI